MRIVLLLVLSCAIAAAQSATDFVTPQMERGRKLIDEAVEALGGENFLAMKNKVEYGRIYSFYQKQLSGLSKSTMFTKYLVAPDPPNAGELYIRERQSFGDKKKEKWAVLFNEFDGWEVTFRGAKPLPDETIERWRSSRLHDVFYIFLRRLNEPGMIFDHRGRELIDNKPLEKVDITDSENRVVTVYLHYKTKLPMRQSYSRRDKDRYKHDEMTIYDKFRDVGGGVMLPYVVQRYRDGDRNFSLFAESIEINQDLTDEKFAIPGDVKVLERDK